MIFRSKDGNLVNIVRSNFKTDTDYYLHIINVCYDKNTNEYNDTYKSQEQNIEKIEMIIKNKY